MDPWLEHGGRTAAARAAFPHAPGPWIDLSTGINPMPWDVTGAGSIDWHRLPDAEALGGLERVAAAFFEAEPARVCAVPGTEIALRLLAALDLPPPYSHVVPGYGTHGEALPGSRAIEAEALSSEAAVGGTILFANPANPTGEMLSPAVIAALAGALSNRGGMLVLDEAFADAMPFAAPPPDDTVIRLRSFGKFFGLAGVRLGFVIADPRRIALLRQRLGSWPLSAGAIAIGTAAYRDEAWIAATRTALPARAARLDALLAHHGLKAGGACPLFRLVSTPDAGGLFRRLAERGILTRPFVARPDWLRLGLPGDDAAFDRLDRALARA